MPSADLIAPQMGLPQSGSMQKPLTIVAAATIAPQTNLTIVSGTTSIATITPPLPDACHQVNIVCSVTNFSGFLTTGNILVASLTNSTVWANKVNTFIYNPIVGKYYPRYAVSTTNGE